MFDRGTVHAASFVIAEALLEAAEALLEADVEMVSRNAEAIIGALCPRPTELHDFCLERWISSDEAPTKPFRHDPRALRVEVPPIHCHEA
ncbi:MAG TPA: hypothetical protein VG270_12375, partial [Pseudolabrys sp.]|nr:hypothetical protein [Pseudolabrys sp.]